MTPASSFVHAVDGVVVTVTVAAAAPVGLDQRRTRQEMRPSASINTHERERHRRHAGLPVERVGERGGRQPQERGCRTEVHVRVAVVLVALDGEHRLRHRQVAVEHAVRLHVVEVPRERHAMAGVERAVGDHPEEDDPGEHRADREPAPVPSTSPHGRSLRHPGGRVHARGEPVAEERQVDEQQHRHHHDARHQHEHEAPLAVELLGILHRAVGPEREVQVHRHEHRDERERQDELEPVAHDERTEEQHRRRRVEHDRHEEALARVVRERLAVSRRVVAGALEVVVLGEALGGHEVAADHPVAHQQRDRRHDRRGHDVPTDEHAQRVVDRLRRDVEVRVVLRTDGREVVEAAHDPEREQRHHELPRDQRAETETDEHQRDPLHVRERDVHLAGRHRPEPLRGVVHVVGRVHQLVDHVVARRDQAHGQEADHEVPPEVGVVDVRHDADRHHDARQHEDVLEPVVDAADANVRTPTGDRRRGEHGGSVGIGHAQLHGGSPQTSRVSADLTGREPGIGAGSVW